MSIGIGVLPLSLCVCVGGVEVQSYLMEVDSSGGTSGEEMTEVYRGANDNHLMEGLLPGKRYLCQVRTYIFRNSYKTT